MNVARELENARQSLLDLTLRNRLLNYRPSRLRSIRVTGELPAEIYDALVLREKTLSFRGTGSRKAAGEETMTETWSPRAAEQLEARHTDRYLQTPYDDESLDRKLFRVYHEGRSVVEEQGYTVTHLALGFLEWFESEEAEQPRRAPLILAPAELERVRAGDFSKVKWTGEDVFANISLIAKLAEHGIVLPPFEAPEEKSGIDAWLQKVAEAVARRPRWRVLSELTLDFFSFTKFVMFKDLDPATWPDERKPHDHPLLQTLFRPCPSDDADFDEKRIDEALTARELWHVMDADPSQIAVVEDVKAGRNLVVQGPPGTGKSQTITNLIAEALAAGKTVLFVSEKMAALEVVKSRLDVAGLGPFCLELHSRKANKKAVLQELERSLGSKPLVAAGEQLLDEHELLKRELNRYASDLGTPFGAYKRSPHQLFGMRHAALAQLQGHELLLLPNAASVSEADVAAAENALRELAYVMPLVAPAGAHPWRASTREAMLPHHEESLRGALTAAIAAADAVSDASAALAQAAGVQSIRRPADVEPTVRAAALLTCADAPTEAALLLSSEWNAPNAAAEELLRRVEAFQLARAELARTFHDEALEANSAAELHELAMRSTRFFRFLDGRYRALRRRLAANFVASAPKVPQMLAELARLVEHQSARDALRADPRGRALFGARWKSDRSDCRALREFADWLVAFRRELVGAALTQRAVDVASGRIDVASIATRVERLREAAALLREAVSAVSQEVCVHIEEDATLDELRGTFERWREQLPALFPWAQFNAARTAMRATPAAALEPLVMSDRLPPELLLPFFRASLAESLLRACFAERRALGQFGGELHEKRIARFRELDAALVDLNRVRVSQRLHAARPRLAGGASAQSEAGILLGELHRKRGHMPIRKLLAKTSGLIQRIKPCFLMSPLSVAQFLDPRSARFDLIVFDEASQVRPEDAVGALLRGSQLVVMGDAQQLPPTSFFDHLGAGDDAAEDDVALADVESILEQCARSYPTKTLNWHYRSRHDSLIAVSNALFYESKLRVYPAAVDRADDLGLHFICVPHAVYDRGGSGMNRLEARIVAAAAIEHCRRFPERSLGIGTFNIKQQQAIQEELEAQLRAQPELEELFATPRREPLFVKNLETIQGDERDVILISVGFGRDAAGQLSANFGPINQEGGERRLNVLISRARRKCVVYANFRAADLPIERTESKGVRALHSFLEYAESRRLMRQTDEDDQPIADAVAAALREAGHEVTQRVGLDKSRVDVAVHDPRTPGRYLLGVLCDGANYHGSPVARDRDRLRQQVLENLGWTIHRVWSMDFYRNRSETIARVLRAAEEAKNAPALAEPAAVFTVSVAAAEEPPPAVIDEAPPYEICCALRIARSGELHEMHPEQLALAVEDVVRVEGPVHVEEVIRRIRTLWGLQRAGNRIREAIDRGAELARRRGIVARDGEFLHVRDTAVRARRRNGDPPARIDLIADAEIAAAAHEVLRAQFATPDADLIDASARRLGFQATSSVTAARVGAVIDAEVARGALVREGDRIRLQSRGANE